jgi:hypothetical protein
MNLKFHYVREQIKDGEIKLSYTPTYKMIADILTKALEKGLFERLRKMLMTGLDEDGNIID